MKKLLLALAVLAMLVAGAVAAAYAMNPAPSVPGISATEASNPTKPYVVKLHAQWCSTCMLTKGVWAEVNEAYAGKVNLVVLDFTNEAKTAASRAEASRLG